jgi:hypothetical protein
MRSAFNSFNNLCVNVFSVTKKMGVTSGCLSKCSTKLDATCCHPPFFIGIRLTKIFIA